MEVCSVIDYFCVVFWICRILGLFFSCFKKNEYTPAFYHNKRRYKYSIEQCINKTMWNNGSCNSNIDQFFCHVDN